MRQLAGYRANLLSTTGSSSRSAQQTEFLAQTAHVFPLDHHLGSSTASNGTNAPDSTSQQQVDSVSLQNPPDAIKSLQHSATARMHLEARSYTSLASLIAAPSPATLLTATTTLTVPNSSAYNHSGAQMVGF